MTCHFIDKEWNYLSYVLNTYNVTTSHTAENIASELKAVTNKWNITEKVICTVTDNASNMTAAVRLTPWKHLPCFAHTLNLIVQNAINSDTALVELCKRCRNIVTFFEKSVRASDKLKDIQNESCRDEKKLIQEVETRWNSTFYMFQAIVDEYREVKLTQCSVDCEDLSISTGDVAVLNEALELLKPFEEATRELSCDTYISLSKVIHWHVPCNA